MQNTTSDLKIAAFSSIALFLMITYSLGTIWGTDLSSSQATRVIIATSGLTVIWIVTLLKYRRLRAENKHN